MPIRKCVVPVCDFVTEDVSDELAAVMLKMHADYVHTCNGNQKPSKVEMKLCVALPYRLEGQAKIGNTS